MKEKLLEKKELSVGKVCALIFIPTLITTGAYIIIGLHWQGIPSIALFYVMTMLILFPFEMGVILIASKKEYGKYSLKPAFVYHEKMDQKKILLYGLGLFCFAGLMSVTITPLEEMLVSPIAELVRQRTPNYFDWTNMGLVRSCSKGLLLFTSILFLVMNSFVGPVIEELFFRGYLTSKLERLQWKSVVIVTILFSLYHLWQPFGNLFRIVTFGVVALITYRKRNIYISMTFHCLCNLFTTINFLIAWWS